jgi:hypothetical protein
MKRTLRFRIPFCTIIVFWLLLLPLFGVTAAPPEFRYQTLIQRLTPLQEITRMAEKHGVTLGIYGGTVRDLYLGHAFTVISDCDLIFNSNEPGFPAFRDELIAYAKTVKGKMPRPDFHFDLAAMENENARQKLYHNEGITATKVGVMRDDTIMDPTGYGVRDLQNRVFRYYPLDRDVIALHNLGRFIRDMIRLPAFSRDPHTVALLARSIERARASETPDGRRAGESARRLKTDFSKGDLVRFPDLITPMRNDLRFLHNDQLDKLTPSFPFDMFYGDLFRSVTQADDIRHFREVCALLHVDALLEEFGYASEAAILMNPAIERRQVFAAFQFPGFQPPVAARSLTFLQEWEQTGRRYSYRVLFEMLASEFPAQSPEARVLLEKKNEFLSPSSWETLSPGDDYRDQILGFLDPEFNLKILPRDRTTKGLDWFLKNYLPYGEAVLQPVAAAYETHVPPHLARALHRGYSPEVAAIDRHSSHSFKDLNAYLGFQMGPEFSALYLHPRTAYGFFALPESESVRLINHLGFPEVYFFNACGFQRRMRTLIGFQPALNRVMIVQCAFSSDEQLLNHQARVYLLLREKQYPEPEKVLVLRDPTLDGSAQPEFLAYLRNLEEPIEVFFGGFTNQLKKLLREPQTLMFGDLVMLTGRLPVRPEKSLAIRASSGTSPSMDDRPEKSLAIRAISGTSPSVDDSSGKPGPRVLALSGFGASYGALPAQIARRLIPHGLKTIVYVGTCGGLKDTGERWSWTIPVRVFRCGPRPEDDSAVVPAAPNVRLKNLALGLNLRPAGIPALHGTVFSPLLETRARIQQLYDRGVNSVDCELYHLATLDKKLGIYALMNITDFPLSERETGRPKEGEITTENSDEQYKIVTRALEAIVADLVEK